jgi:DNA-binding transcriptional LysR family regulator
MLDVRRLRLLLEVHRRGTIAAAAEALGYTPSAVSQQLAALEREAGVPLLERDGRRVRPTPAAQALLERTQRILADLEEAELELASAHTEPSGVITAGAFPTAAETLLIPACAELRMRHPKIVPAIHQILPEPGIDQLRNGQLDLLIAKRYDHVPAPAAGGLVAHELLTEKLVVAVLDGHPAAGRVTKLARFAQDDWIAGDASTVFGEVVQRACQAAGFEPRIAHRAEDLAIQQSLVRAGFGVALMPPLTGGNPMPGVAFVPLADPDPSRHIYALTRRGAEQRPEIAALLQSLTSQAGALRPDRPARNPRQRRGRQRGPTRR